MKQESVEEYTFRDMPRPENAKQQIVCSGPCMILRKETLALDIKPHDDLITAEVSENGFFCLKRFVHDSSSTNKKCIKMWADVMRDTSQTDSINPGERITAVLPLELEHIVIGFGKFYFST
jgi:hypothetical protein